MKIKKEVEFEISKELIKEIINQALDEYFEKDIPITDQQDQQDQEQSQEVIPELTEDKVKSVKDNERLPNATDDEMEIVYTRFHQGHKMKTITDELGVDYNNAYRRLLRLNQNREDE